MASVPITKIPDGMRDWCYQAPPLDLDKIEVWREGWTDTHIMGRNDGHPSMNVAGLYWRVPRERPPEITHAIN